MIRSRFSSSNASIFSSYSSRNEVRASLLNEVVVPLPPTLPKFGSGSLEKRNLSGCISFKRRFSSCNDLHTLCNSSNWSSEAPPGPNLLPSWRRSRSISPERSLLFLSAFLTLSSSSVFAFNASRPFASSNWIWLSRFVIFLVAFSSYSCWIHFTCSRSASSELILTSYSSVIWRCNSFAFFLDSRIIALPLVVSDSNASSFSFNALLTSACLLCSRSSISFCVCSFMARIVWDDWLRSAAICSDRLFSISTRWASILSIFSLCCFRSDSILRVSFPSRSCKSWRPFSMRFLFSFWKFRSASSIALCRIKRSSFISSPNALHFFVQSSTSSFNFDSLASDSYSNCWVSSKSNFVCKNCSLNRSDSLFASSQLSSRRCTESTSLLDSNSFNRAYSLRNVFNSSISSGLSSLGYTKMMRLLSCKLILWWTMYEWHTTQHRSPHLPHSGANSSTITIWLATLLLQSLLHIHSLAMMHVGSPPQGPIRSF